MKPSNQPPSAKKRGIKKRKTHTPVEVLARKAVDAMLDKKARDVAVMDMRAVSGVADLFVVGTGDSDLQIRAIADAVKEQVREATSERPWHVEGNDHYQWVLLDYVDLVVHVFDQERRQFYDLERLWGDADIVHVTEDQSAADVEMLQDAAPSS